MAAQRFDRVRAAMADRGVDVLLLSVGADLPWLTGYEAMPLERLTMLVLPVDGDATLVVPALEAPRVRERPALFALRPWGETEDPVAIVADLVGRARAAAIGNRTWSQFLLALQGSLPGTAFRPASEVLGPLRAVKEPDEIAALRGAAAAVDRIAAALQAGEIPLVGRTEADISAELSRRILAEGHHRVNFAIVAAGENAASAHHEPGDRVVQPGEIVLCDFGGAMVGADGVGYCSDITRCVHVGEVPAELAEQYAALRAAQAAGVAAATVGTPGEAVDAAARRVLADAGLGEAFVHRTGHGIGVEEHEDPYLVAGNAAPLVAGNAFSIEPGFYLPGRWGARLEDIVVATPDGPDALNRVDHDLVAVDR
ncbi:MAG: Xaa-Pro peptidase family protein [Acidimicrobiales bacterium]|jgi:Xaa-Pro aminopeptidase|nr:Xaa-Pro peptidase family protein [Acidimicrobiales bacterium]